MHVYIHKLGACYCTALFISTDSETRTHYANAIAKDILPSIIIDFFLFYYP